MAGKPPDSCSLASWLIRPQYPRSAQRTGTHEALVSERDDCGGTGSGQRTTWRAPRAQNFLDLVSDTNTHAARTRTGATHARDPSCGLWRRASGKARYSLTLRRDR